jgi:Putative bacterial sensory transduction regulator
MTTYQSDEGLDGFERAIDTWLTRALAENPAIVAVDRSEPGEERRWYVRLAGEEKDYTTVWLTLRQRMLHYETYVMPAPEENAGELYEHLLRRNAKLVGAQFAIGPEDAVYLVGALPLAACDEAELDRVIGSVFAAVEQCFRPALRIGFASRFRR